MPQLTRALPVVIALLALLHTGCGSASAQATTPSTRSTAAGSWNLTVSGTRPYRVHLAGTDLALTGAWMGLSEGDYYSGVATGELAGGVLRIALHIDAGGSNYIARLVEVTLAADAKSGSGFAVEYGFPSVPVAVERVLPPSG